MVAARKLWGSGGKKSPSAREAGVEIHQDYSAFDRCRKIFPVDVEDFVHLGGAQHNAAQDGNGPAADIRSTASRRHGDPVGVGQFHDGGYLFGGPRENDRIGFMGPL
jgi:hypothetical protein